MTTRFDGLFGPYLSLRLSAFDNMKLVVAVLFDAGESYQCVEAKMQSLACHDEMTTGYFVCWDHVWLFCGLTHSYSASISLLTDIERIEKASIKSISVPVMSMQQVEFMCVESAHFDHC
ncbi:MULTISPECIES: hypothetical protein [Shewanella]|uniref:hypothetical protein n=1 Tax=Shewanella TaxID=22 RepID=UPI00200E76DC|nr:hypothetical protein [Shewanella basaltis]MCL1114845.1 hypothetical protein [Shewanella basaltis]